MPTGNAEGVPLTAEPDAVVAPWPKFSQLTPLGVVVCAGAFQISVPPPMSEMSKGCGAGVVPAGPWKISEFGPTFKRGGRLDVTVKVTLTEIGRASCRERAGIS